MEGLNTDQRADRMSQNEKTRQMTIKQLAESASTGNWHSLLTLIHKSNDSEEAAVTTADLLFEGAGKIRPDAGNAFAFYYMAALKGNQHSLDVLAYNSNFDRDADYYLYLTKTETPVLSKIEELVDLEKLFKTQGTEMPGTLEKPPEQPKQKRAPPELSEESKRLKEERDKLNSEINVWAQKRNELNGQAQELFKKAAKCKEERDEYNRKVKGAKIKRDEANRKIAELSCMSQTTGANTSRSVNNGPSVEELKREFENLEHIWQNRVLKKREEEAIVRRLKELDTQIREIEYRQRQSGGTSSKSQELREAMDEAEKWHKLVSEYAMKAQSKHDEMQRLYEQADAVKKQADEAHYKFIETKKKADEAHKKFMDSKKVPRT